MTNLIARALTLLLLAPGLPLRAQDSVTTLAGQAVTAGSTNGPAAIALFSTPAAMVADSGGNLYVADSQNHAIRKIGTNGLVSTIAGHAGAPGSGDGPGTQSRFDTPSGIAMDPAGNAYVSDTGNHIIRRITVTGVVTTVAGRAGQSGFTDGIGTSARFNSPLGVVVAPNWTIYVADCGNHLIRAISPGGAVTTLAGSPETWGSDDGAGSSARFNGPVGLALDDQGNLFVSDSNNHAIRKITPDGRVATWAGVPAVDGWVDGDRVTARFTKPAELAFDKQGNLFVADSFNHVIRKISSDGEVATVTGVAGSHGSADGANGKARWFNPYGLAIRPDGSLVVADAYNELIRVVTVPFKAGVHFLDGSPGATLSWNSVVGKEYQVQYRSGFGSASWVDLGGPVTAASLSTTLTDSIGDPEGQRFYRVMVVQ
jgi:sugar lactone lactonase YvrE